MTNNYEGPMSDGLRVLAEQVIEDRETKPTDQEIERDRRAVQEAAAKSRALDDNEALTLVGAVVGDFYVKDRVHTGKRWRYIAHNTRTGRDHYLRGYELVREVKATVRNGGVVILPNFPWRDEQGSNGTVVTK